jgi:hypothetical protein
MSAFGRFLPVATGWFRPKAAAGMQKRELCPVLEPALRLLA